MDEIERLNKEFKAQPQAPPAPLEQETPPEPEPVVEEEPQEEVQEDADEIAEPPEEDEEVRPLKALPKKALAKPGKKGAPSANADFAAKIEKIKKKLETSSEVKSVQQETSRRMEDFKVDFNKKLNNLIDQVREVNSAFKKYDAHEDALIASQQKIEELQAHVDDLALRLRDLDKVETLRKELVAVKNAVKADKYAADIQEIRAQTQDNAEKLKQMLALVEMLTER